MESTPVQAGDAVPQFTQALVPTSVKFGEKISLDVTVQGAPKPKLYWFHEKRKIRDSRHVQLLEEENAIEGSPQVELKSSLVIDRAEEFDSGKYTIRAINRSGLKSSSVNLVVKGDYCLYLSLVLAYMQALYCPLLPQTFIY